MILVIYGGRDFDDYELLCQECDKARGITLVLCGEAPGADRLGKKWANERGIPVKSMPADWDGLGKRAGKVRNTEMAKLCHSGIGFWDGKSPGTKHMNGRLKAFNKPHRVVKYTHNNFTQFEEKSASGSLEDLL